MPGMPSLPSTLGKREDAYHPNPAPHGHNPLRVLWKGGGRVSSSAQGYLLRACLHMVGELGKRTVKHTQARLGHPVIRGGWGLCGPVELLREGMMYKSI